MSKHTPAPWTIADNIGKKGQLGIVADSAPCIIAVMGNQKAWPIEAKANARLIAAAPELLELLKEATKVLAMSANNEEETPHDDDLARTCSPDDPQGCLICECEAAIAKAEGE